MCYDYNEFENYYEPSKADEIFDEAMEKFKEILKEDVKTNMKYIQEENAKLKKENEDLKEKTRNLDNRERNLEVRERDLESKSEWTFYEKKFSEILKPLEEQLDMWFVEPISELIPKCNLCDNERKIDYISSTGKTIKGDCDCRKYQTVYIVSHRKVKHLDFYKSDSRDKKFILTPKYDSRDYDDTYFKLNIQQLIKTFEINKVSEYKHYGNYGGFTGFATKEECKKYCDWLNSQMEDLEEDEEE